MFISVILPVYNGAKFLPEAIESILEQSHKDIELICIDDGSTDNTLRILKKYEKIDPRVRVVSRENKGLVYSLNEGIQLSRFRYIARMDADDVCEENRLSQQLKEMCLKKLDILGCSYSIIDEKGQEIGKRNLPRNNEVIKWMMTLGSPLCHPSVLFDSKKLGKDLYYDSNSKHCEDFELWLRCRDKGYIFGNTKERLIKYRIISSSISRKYSHEQRKKSIELVYNYTQYIKEIEEARYLLYGRLTSLQHLRNVKLLLRFFRHYRFREGVFIMMYLYRSLFKLK